METVTTNYKRVTLKLSDESYKILLDQSKDKKREKIIQESLLLYSETKRIHTSLLDILHIVKYIKISIEYMNFNLFVEEKETEQDSPYHKNYNKAIGLLSDLEIHLENLRVAFFKP
jgi:hypothetical protein